MMDKKGDKSPVFAWLIFVAYLFLVVFSQSSSAHDLGIFLLLMGLCFTGVFSFYIYLRYAKKELSAKFVFVWALIFHFLGILGAPLFEDDYYRYLWDAYHSVTYGSPYGIAPSTYFNTIGTTFNTVPDNFQAILSGINYPDVPTIYGPTLQYSFLLAYLIAPGEIWALQFIYSVVDLALIVILLQLAKPKFVMLYAWSPLVFKEVLLTAHPDGLAVCLLVASVFCSVRKYYYWMAIFLAASLAAKVFALIFVPFMLIRKKISVMIVFFITLVALYLPLTTSDASDLLGLSAMAQHWEFNAAFYYALSTWFSSQTTKIILGSMLFIGFGAYFLRNFLFEKTDNLTALRGDMMMGFFLLCAPVINPWYLIWVLPFAVIHFSVTAWFASVMIMMSYLIGLNLEGFEGLAPYQQPIWVQPIEFGAILAVLLVEVWKRQKNTRATVI